MPKKIRDWIDALLPSGILLAALFVVFWPFAVSGGSMEPALYDLDRIAISRAAVWLGRLNHGDLAVCRQERGDSTENVVKRIIGVPGDVLEIRGGNVYINGELLSEDYLIQAYTAGDIVVTLADGEYFVMGDNRAVSYDSRSAGPVSVEAMVGRVVMRWFPFDKITAY
ncbi:MAG: signal peptidase I [Defluviitaleaceae bacterium]|nr:signal peptidase I [Defluviitaleaceae bacterium]